MSCLRPHDAGLPRAGRGGPWRILIVGVHHGAAVRGASVAVRGLAMALQERGHAVTLLEAARPEHRQPLPGVRHLYVGTLRKSVYPLRAAARSLRRFDIVHTHDHAGGGIALRSRVERRLPWVAQLQPPHVHAESFWRAGWRWRYIGLAARRAPSLLVPSRWLADALAARYGLDRARLHVVPCGLASHWLSPPPAPDAGDAPARIVLVNMKGVAVALRAFAKLVPEPAARLELYGEDADAAAHARLARALGVAERVRFEGFVPNAALPARLAGAAALVHPTRGESFGQVLAEAAALGIPAVVSRVGATPEVVEDGETGFLCPPDEPEAFAAALERLLADAPLRRRLGAAARVRARREWAWDAVVRRVEETVYAPLLASRERTQARATSR